MQQWYGRFVIIGGIIALAAVGLIKKIRELKHYYRSLDQVVEYQNYFHKYLTALEANQPTNADYTYLIKNSSLVQRTLAGYGVIESFKPPYGQVIYKRYPVILNAIPEIDSWAHNNPLSGFRGSNDVIMNYVRIVDNSIIRYSGAVEDHIQSIEADLKNPIIWISEGIKLLLLPVLYLPKWFGILSENTVQKAANSLLFKLFSFTIFIITSLSSLFAVVLGWDQFIAKISQVEFLANLLNLK